MNIYPLSTTFQLAQSPPCVSKSSTRVFHVLIVDANVISLNGRYLILNKINKCINALLCMLVFLYGLQKPYG